MNFCALRSSFDSIGGSATGALGAKPGAVFRLGRAFAWRWLGVLVMGFWGLAPLEAEETPPLLDAGLVQVKASAERSTLNRVTGVLTSAVDIEATNVSGQRIDGPIHAVIAFKAAGGAGVREGVAVVDARGGFGEAPWQQPFFDLTAQLGPDGWQPGAVLRVPLTFSRSRTLSVLYEVRFAGRVNRDPVVNPGGPYAGRAGAAIAFAGAASDPDGDALTFAWDFGAGAGAATAEAVQAFAAAGVPRVTLTVSDGRGGVVVREVAVLVAPPGAFALGHTRAVDGTGHPLGGVQVAESGPLGNRAFEAGEEGFVSLGLTAGDYGWTFSAPGHRPVYRQATLLEGEVKRLPSPWLAREGGPAEVSVLEATTLKSDDKAASVVFPAGAFTQPGQARLTALGPQTLPLPLPFGWSPLAAFHLDLPETPALPGAARLRLAESVALGESVTVVRFDESARVWRVLQTGPADAAHRDEWSIDLAESGTVAALVRDEGAGAPPLAASGAELPTGAVQDLESLVAAVGSATPREKAASLDPNAVTAVGEAVLTPETDALPSGSWFRLGVQETYDLSDGRGLRTPDYDATMFAYRRPGPGGRSVRAAFPLRPRLLLSPAELKVAHVHVEVLPPHGDGSAVLSEAGGSLSAGGFQVAIPPQVLGGAAVGSLRSLEVASFSGLVGPGFVTAGAFELNLAGLAPGRSLAFSMTHPVAPGADFMLAKWVSFSGSSGLAPVQRLHSNVAGVLVDGEPESAPRLPGLAGPGQYVLVQLPAAQGMVSGVVRTSGATPAVGIATRVTGQPWLSATGADGRYFLSSPAGDGTVLATHATNGDGAAAALAMPAALAAQAVDLTLGPLAPRVLAIAPPDKARKVAVVSPITVEFSEKIAPASLGAAPLTLRAAGADIDVPASFTLDLANRIVTLLPVNSLDPATEYTLTISEAIRDQQNLALAGPREFTFATAAPAARGIGAQLVIYEPGAAGPTPADQALINAIPGYTPGTDAGKVVAIGSVGSADPEVPVILVNESTGTTATVLSKADGSFANCIDAAAEDFISAVFVNGNGTRISIPATKQKFDDGRTGLYQQGGILEASSEEVPGDQVTLRIEPNAIPVRTVFRMESLPLAEIYALTRNTQPEVGKILAGIQFEVTQGGAADQAPSKISFPLDPAVLKLPSGVEPERGAFALALPIEVEGEVAYQVVDKLTYANGRVTTNSFIGLFAAGFAGTFGNYLGNSAVLVYHGTDPAVIRGRVGEERPINAFEGLQGAAEVAAMLVDPYGLTESDAFFRDPTLSGASPLAGAFVTARPPNVPPGVPGRVRAGTSFYTSERDGAYSLILPFTLANTAENVPTWTVEASHPRFSHVARKAATFGMVFGSTAPRVNLVFDAEDAVPFGQGAGIALDLNVSVFPPAAAIDGEIQVSASASGPVGSTSALEFSIKDVAHEVPAPGNSFSDLQTTPGAAAAGSSPSQTRRTDKFTSSKALTSLIKVVATVTHEGRTLVTEKQVLIRFGTPPPVVVDPQSPLALDDVRPPSVAWTIPGPNQFLPPGQAIVIGFSEPLNPHSVKAPPLGNGVTVSPEPAGGLRGMILAPDKKTLTIPMPALPPSATGFTVTIGPEVKDLAGNAFDQTAGTEGSDVFNLTVPIPPKVSFPLTGISQAGGSVMHGGYAYVADRGASPHVIRVFDLEGLATGAVPQVAAITLPSFPRDLALIADWSFRRNRNAPVETKDLLMVTCGLAGTGGEGEDGGQQQILRVFDVSQPEKPVLLQGAVLSNRNALINRLVWRAPYFAYVESGADFQFVSVVDLQALMVGFQATAADQATFGDKFFAGADLNRDGDYADQGDLLPIPEKAPMEFFGKRFFLDATSAPQFGTIQDMDFQQGTVAIVTAGTEGRFKVLMGQNSLLTPSEGMIETFGSLRPRRVTLLMDEPVRQLDGTPGGSIERRNLALVSVSRSEGDHELWIISLADPRVPEVLEKVTLPRSMGTPGGIVKRDDGLLVLAMEQDGLLLDLTRSRSAPIIGIVPGAGTGSRTFAADASGIGVTAQGSDSEVTLGPPLLQFVGFPFQSGLIDPEALVGNESRIQTLLNTRRPSVVVPPARLRTEGGAQSTLTPPLAGAHHHVLVRAPGAAGPSMRLSLEMLNESYLPARNRGKNIAPVRAMSRAGVTALRDSPRPAIDAPISELKAWRLSSDKTSVFYNMYLSDPFAVLEESVTPDELSALQAVGRRKILGGSDKLHAIRASIDPVEASNLAISGYAGRVDPASFLLQPGTYALAETRAGINLGNPPPVGGDFAFPGTLDSVMALSGELRRTEVDLELPSRRMPIVFSRTCAHATESEDFGEGWDHFYNQRLIERSEKVIPQGSLKPLVIRATPDQHKLARPGDVEFIDGEGRTILFQKLTDDSADPARTEVSLDPIWEKLLSNPAAPGTWYAPPASEPGVFDIMFKDDGSGQFIRVTPDGSSFWYSADGLLMEIRDKYGGNRQVIDRKEGRIRRITDKSVEGDRYLLVHRFRHPGEALSGKDRATDNARIAGRICSIEDYAGRMVSYQYDVIGRLSKFISFETSSGKGGFSGTPQKTYLTPGNGSPEVIGVVEGNGSHAKKGGASGPALLKASTVDGEKNFGRPVATRADGEVPPVNVDVKPDNRPATNAEATHAATNALSQVTEVQFDSKGFPTEIKTNGPSTGSESPSEGEAIVTFSHDVRGRPGLIKLEEGNSIEYTFDTTAEFFRSRGNLLKITRKPGPFGGPTVITEIKNYDPLHNIAQSMVNPNGFTISLTLRPDKRDVELSNFDGAGTGTVSRNEFGQVTSERSPDGQMTSFEYSKFTGFITSRTLGSGADGITTTYSYGADPNSVAHLLGMPTGIQLPHGASAAMSYDNRLLPVRMARGDQLEETGYDENGNVIRFERAVGGGQAPYLEERRYRQNNFLDEVKVIELARGTGQSGDPLITTYGPDELLRAKTIVMPGGETRELTFDHRSNVLKDRIGPFEQTFEYDRNGNLRKVQAGGATIAEMTYDGQDRRIVARKFNEDAIGNEISTSTYFNGGELRTQKITTTGLGTQQEVEILEVDALGRPKRRVQRGGQATADQSISYSQGEAGGLTTTIAGPVDTVTQVSDAAGRLVSNRNAIGTTTVEYGNNNELPTKVTSVEDGQTYTASTIYNALDHPTSQSDGFGVVWDNGVPRLDGRLTSRKNAKGAEMKASFSQTGTLLELDRAVGSGLKTRFGYDRNLQPAVIEDPAQAGHGMSYDATLRLRGKTLRSGGAFAFKSPDGRNNPTSITMPDGQTSTANFDPQSRPIVQVSKFGTQEYRIQNAKYDAQSRLRSVDYGSVQHAGSVNQMRLTHDPLGPLVETSYTEGGMTFSVRSEIRADGARTKLKYPGGGELAEGRDNSARLTSLAFEGSGLLDVEQYAGAGMPGLIKHGGLITETNTYDARRRLTSRCYVRDGDGGVLAELRFLHDATDNVLAVQNVHAHGRADVFEYDAANRLTFANHGLLPTLPGAEAPEVPKSLYNRGFNYDPVGLDVLLGGILTNPSALPVSPSQGHAVPAFAPSISGQDNFLFARNVDGFDRGAPDALGQARATVLFPRSTGASDPERMNATGIVHNGLGHLEEITRADGTRITYQYQPNGLLHSRIIRVPGNAPTERAYVWDMGRLIEERSVSGGGIPTVVARYYYDDGDTPTAADIRDSGGNFQRYYYLRRHDMSIVGVADASGNVVERVHYSSHGMPVIEKRDTVAPVLARVTSGGASSVIVEFSEPAFPATTPVPTPDLITAFADPSGVFSAGNAGLAATWLAAVPGQPFGTRVRLQISDISKPLQIVLNPGTVFDEWGNANTGESVDIVPGQAAGTVLYSPAGITIGSTAPERTARSTVGNPFLFHGQFTDDDTGLVYMRARWYDPYTGTFLERDPMEFTDSVNLYAGMGNNPVSYRDPTGRSVVGKGSALAITGMNAWKSRLAVMAKKQEAVSKDSLSLLSVVDPYFQRMRSGFKDYKPVLKIVRDDTMEEFGKAYELSNVGGGLGARLFWRGEIERIERVNTMGHEFFHFLRIAGEIRNPFGNYSNWRALVWEEALANKAGFALELKLIRPGEKFTDDFLAFQKGGDEWLLKTIHRRYKDFWKRTHPTQFDAFKFSEADALSLSDDIRKATSTLGGAITP